MEIQIVRTEDDKVERLARMMWEYEGQNGVIPWLAADACDVSMLKTAARLAIELGADPDKGKGTLTRRGLKDGDLFLFGDDWQCMGKHYVNDDGLDDWAHVSGSRHICPLDDPIRRVVKLVAYVE